MIYAVILAGGRGIRLWPLSSLAQPKQFLNICGQRSLLEETIQRILPLTGAKNIYVATSSTHTQKIKESIKKFKIPDKNLFFESVAKNTLAPIAFLTNEINKIDKEAIVVVLPCDHLVRYNNRFIKCLKKGIEIARDGYIVTLGIKPHRPETGYGYIKIKSKIPAIKSPQCVGDPPKFCGGIGGSAKNFGGKNKKSKIYKVGKFIEKPQLQKAKRFIKDKRYYWNSGIFIFSPKLLLGEIKKFKPTVYKIIRKIDRQQNFNRLWQGLPCISIDYAIMQKTREMALLPADYGWVDLGSWQAIEEVIKKDKFGNIFKGNCIDIGTKNSIVWSDKRLVATLGLKDMIVVDTKEALLVSSKEKSQDLKKIIQRLNSRRSLKSEF